MEADLGSTGDPSSVAAPPRRQSGEQPHGGRQTEVGVDGVLCHTQGAGGLGFDQFLLAACRDQRQELAQVAGVAAPGQVVGVVVGEPFHI